MLPNRSDLRGETDEEELGEDDQVSENETLKKIAKMSGNAIGYVGGLAMGVAILLSWPLELLFIAAAAVVIGILLVDYSKS